MDYCWRMETFEQPVSYRVLPSPFVDIIFPLKGSIFIASLNREQRSPFFVPLLDQFKQVRIAPDSRITGIRLRPAYANLLLRSGHMLEKNANEAAEVMDPFIYQSLLNLVRGERDLAALTAATDQLLAYSIRMRDRDIDFLFDSSFEKCLQRETKIGTLTRDLNVSGRWLEKVYSRQIHMSPKSLQQLARFNYFVHATLRFPEKPLSHLAPVCGYYDQSHLVREVKKFSGLSPTQLKEVLSPAHREMNHC